MPNGRVVVSFLASYTNISGAFAWIDSSSTMPRAGFMRYPESYSVYVNGPSKGGYRHEVMVPMHEGGAPVIPRPEGSTGSSATKDSANSSSLATHV